MTNATFENLLEEALNAASDIEALRRPDRDRMDAATYLAKAYGLAGKSASEITKLRDQINALPAISMYRPLRAVLDILIRYTVEHWREPPEHEFPTPHVTKVGDEVLLVVLLDLRISRRDLIAVAGLIATERHPEVFAQGYSDRKAYEQEIAAAEQRRRDAVGKAARAWTFENDTRCRNGFVTFNLGGNVEHVGNGPGDEAAIDRLLTYLRVQRDAPVEEEAA